VHRMYDNRSVAQCVSDAIKIAVGNPGIAEMSKTVY